MAFGGLSGDQADQPMAEINMIPLIDVMLVLLIIFIVTAPLLSHAIKVDLPKASSEINAAKTEDILLAIDQDGIVYWGREKLAEGEWIARMQEAAEQNPQPELLIHADQSIAYKRVVRVMSDAARTGLGKIGFVTTQKMP